MGSREKLTKLSDTIFAVEKNITHNGTKLQIRKLIQGTSSVVLCLFLVLYLNDSFTAIMEEVSSRTTVQIAKLR